MQFWPHAPPNTHMKRTCFVLKRIQPLSSFRHFRNIFSHYTNSIINLRLNSSGLGVSLTRSRCRCCSSSSRWSTARKIWVVRFRPGISSECKQCASLVLGIDLTPTLYGCMDLEIWMSGWSGWFCGLDTDREVRGKKDVVGTRFAVDIFTHGVIVTFRISAVTAQFSQQLNN